MSHKAYPRALADGPVNDDRCQIKAYPRALTDRPVSDDRYQIRDFGVSSAQVNLSCDFIVIIAMSVAHETPGVLYSNS